MIVLIKSKKLYIKSTIRLTFLLLCLKETKTIHSHYVRVYEKEKHKANEYTWVELVGEPAEIAFCTGSENANGYIILHFPLISKKEGTTILIN